MGSGLPETPQYAEALSGSGVVGVLRPSLTGQPIYARVAGAHLNAGAFTAPASGEWGTAGRYSITGPDQFSFDSALQRTFRMRHNISLDGRIDATNLMNHAVYSSWNTTLGSTFFGQPVAANAMRSLHTTLRLRF
jgi:hypothetical protein